MSYLERKSPVPQIGVSIDDFFDKEIIYVVLAPHLDRVMDLFKRLETVQIQLFLAQYEGVIRVMREVEEGTQVLEKELSGA